MALQKHHSIRAAGVLAAILSLNVLLLPVMTSADDYSVTAKVPFPAPTQAAAFDPALDQTTVQNALKTVTGTCELQNPQGVVSVWRSGISIGSTICNGTFSLQIMLQAGANVLIARSASASGLYGPDSSPITITLNLPAGSPSQAPPPESSVPNTNTPPVASTNAGAAIGLTVTTSQPFSTLPDSNDISIAITIAGGARPYSIALNWGDGSVESRTADAPGSYTFVHHYTSAISYNIRGQVRDSQGAVAMFSYAVVSTNKTPGSSHHTSVGTLAHKPAFQLAALFVFAVLLLLAGDYWLGWHQAKKHFMKILNKRRTGKKKRRTQKKSRKKA